MATLTCLNGPNHERGTGKIKLIKYKINSLLLFYLFILFIILFIYFIYLFYLFIINFNIYIDYTLMTDNS